MPRETALQRAARVTARAREVGFDWPAVAPVLDKVDEELRELREAIGAGHPDAIAGELGDLLFAVVNVARFVAVDPEAALERTTGRFLARFAYIEERLAAEGLAARDVTLDRLDALWNEAKAAGIGVVGRGVSTESL